MAAKTDGRNSGLTGWLGVKRPAARIPALGGRELAVLEILWRRGQVSAQQVLEQMSEPSLALSTVQSTLERLHRKDLVSRAKLGRAYYYRATLAKSDMISNLLRDIAQEITGGDMAPMISGFMGYISGEAPGMEPELAQALHGHRRGAGAKGAKGSADD